MGRHDHIDADDTLTGILPVVVDPEATVPSVLVPLADEEHVIDGLGPTPKTRLLRTDIDSGDIATIAIWMAISAVTGVWTSLFTTPWLAAGILAALSGIAGTVLVGRVGFRGSNK